MGYALGPQEQRETSRISLECPAQISIGSQLTVQGRLKDLSSKSAFITMNSSVYLKVNDEVGFAIQRSPTDAKFLIEGLARISRIVVGEGMAIYFTRLQNGSEARLKELVGDTHVQA